MDVKDHAVVCILMVTQLTKIQIKLDHNKTVKEIQIFFLAFEQCTRYGYTEDRGTTDLT